jgi:hypothetical protein
MRRRCLLLPIASCVLLAGCGSDTPEAFGPTPSTPKVVVEQGFDDPKDPEWGFARGQRVVDGALVLSAGPQDAVRSSPAKDRTIDDVTVEATVGSNSITGDEASFGVICRWRLAAGGKRGDYYAFTIAPNGYAAIGTTHDFLWQTAKPVPAIRKGRDATNVVRAECVGDRLTMYVNDTKVHSVVDDSIAAGDVAVTLENYARRGRATAHFDDVRVLATPDE